MNTSVKHPRFAFVTALVLMFASFFITDCQVQPTKPEQFKLTRLFPANAGSGITFDENIIASPLLDLSQARPLVIVPNSNGVITALDSETGALAWDIKMPAPNNQEIQVISTPVIIDNHLVVLYQCLDKGVRTSHRMAVINLANQKVDQSFPILVLSAEKPDIDGATVKFNPPTAYSHSALKHAAKPGSKWGRLYASFGNAGDAQPFHGWMFEIDMDAWRKQGTKQAVSNVLLTTPEAKCPVAMEYGTQELICGGGIWTPGGALLIPAGEGFELLIPTGNGQIDIPRHDYANTVMRVKPDLSFDDGCDKELCKNFDPKQPSRACLASCKNLFVPRPPENNLRLKPSNRECENRTFGECLAWMDYDLGASSPVIVTLKDGTSYVIQPGKEGAVYLIDAKHLGTQYDRLQVVEICGAPNDMCKGSWMGMIVTQPVVAYINDEPVVILPAFMPDQTHPAGVITLKIVREGSKPTLQKFWQFPNPNSPKALEKFRSHPSLPVMSKLGDETIVWIVDVGNPGVLYGIRLKDGTVAFEQPLLGSGRQLAAPLVYKNTLYMASKLPKTGKITVEAYRIEAQ